MNTENKQKKTASEDSGADKTPGAAAPSSSQSKSKTPTGVKLGWGWRLLILLPLVIVLALAGLGVLQGPGLWERWTQMRSALIESRDAAAGMEGLERQLADVDSRLNHGDQQTLEVEATLRAELKELREQLQTLQHELSDNGPVDRSAELLDEAEFLLRLAGQRLLVERGASGSLTLLHSADQILKSLDDPRLLGVRRAIANDIAQLQAVDSVDIEGLFLRIDVVSAQVLDMRALPAAGIRLQVDDGAEPGEGGDSEAGVGVTAPPSVPWYQALWHNAKTAGESFLDRHFYIRDVSEPLPPLMSEAEELRLRRAMVAQLAVAQYAILRDQQEIYQRSLLGVAEALSRYYADGEETRRIRERLAELANERIARQLPDISESLVALKAYRTRRAGSGEES